MPVNQFTKDFLVENDKCQAQLLPPQDGDTWSVVTGLTFTGSLVCVKVMLYTLMATI